MSESKQPVAVDGEVQRLRAERDALQAQLSTLSARRRRSGALRRAAALVLVLLACLSLTATAVAVWAEELVADTLPEDRAFLAAPLSSAIQSFRSRSTTPNS